MICYQKQTYSKVYTTHYLRDVFSNFFGNLSKPKKQTNNQNEKKARLKAFNFRVSFKLRKTLKFPLVCNTRQDIYYFSGCDYPIYIIQYKIL